MGGGEYCVDSGCDSAPTWHRLHLFSFLLPTRFNLRELPLKMVRLSNSSSSLANGRIPVVVGDFLPQSADEWRCAVVGPIPDSVPPEIYH